MNQKWKKWFGWSKSRADLFRDCRKRYSFQYLFKYEPGEAAAMAKALGKLSGLAIHKGILLHHEIERVLKADRQGRREPPEAARRRLETAYDVLSNNAEARLLEARFGQWDADETRRRLDEARQDSLRQLDAFFEVHWPRYQGLEVLALEELERFEVSGLKLWVSADLVVRDPDGAVLLVDWKTGVRESPADESIQLTAYVLWATERLGAPVEQVAGELVWLASGNVDRTTREEQDIDALIGRMRVETGEMLAIDSYEQIEASPEERKCRRCPFMPLCREAKDWIDPAAKKRVLGGLRSELGGGGRGRYRR